MAQVITSALAGAMARKFLPEMVHFQESNKSSPAAQAIPTKFMPEVEGVVTLVNPGTGAEGFIEPGADLPTGGNVIPKQAKYLPKPYVDRILIPMGVVGYKSKDQAVNTLETNFKAAAKRATRNKNRQIWQKETLTLTGAVASGVDNFEVADPSGFRINQQYDVYNGSTLVETVTVAKFDQQAASGTFTVTLTANTTAAWSIGYVLYLNGARDNGPISLAEVCSSTGDLYGVSSTDVPLWQGLDRDQGGALTASGLGNLMDDVKVATDGEMPDFHATNPRTLRSYLGLFADKRRYRTGDKADQDILVPEFDGLPILTGAEIPEGVWYMLNKDDICVHEFKKLGPVEDGEMDYNGKQLNQSGLIRHATKYAKDMVIDRLWNLRAEARNSHARLYGIA